MKNAAPGTRRRGGALVFADAVDTGAIDKVRAVTAINLFDQVRAMTWRLLHPRG